MENQKGFAHLILIIFVALAIGVGGFFGYQKLFQKSNLTSMVKQGVKPTNKVSVKVRSKAPSIITKVATAKAIDVKTSLPIQLSNKFTTKDKTVYLSLVLNSPQVGTRIDYIRYLNGRYLDHKSVKLTNPNQKALAFDWVAKTAADRPVGVYRVRTYTNGILEKRANYTVVKDVSLTFASLLESYYYLTDL